MWEGQGGGEYVRNYKIQTKNYVCIYIGKEKDRKRYSCENGIEKLHPTEAAMVADGEFGKIESGRMDEVGNFWIFLRVVWMWRGEEGGAKWIT